jgi:TP901 family phage tail tape measure protein
MDSVQSLGSLVVTLYANGQQFFGTFQKAEKDAELTMAAVTNSVKVMSAAVVTALAAIGTASVIQFAKFDEAMTNSLAIMENVSRQTRTEMEGIARDIAKNTRTSAVEAATAYRFLGSAGLSAAQAMAALPQVAKFAAASNIQAEQATALLTRSLAGLGLASNDAAEYQKNLIRVMDVLTTAANVADGDATDYAISLRTKVGAALRLLNKDVEEGVAVLMAYGKQGILAENAGEMLSQALRDLQKAANENVGVWRSMGVTVYDARGRMLPLVDIISQLEQSMGGMSDEQKALTLGLMGFQDRSVAAIKALFGTSDAIKEYERQLRQAGGATQAVADKQLTSLNAQLNITKNRFNDWLITIGEKLAPVVRMLNTEIGNMTTAVGTAGGEVETFGSFLQTSFLVVITKVADALYGWQLIMKYLEMGIIGVMGAFKFASLTIQVAVLTAGTIIESVFRGWQLIFATAIGGIKVGFAEFAVWAKTKAIEVARMLNEILPKRNQYDSGWFDAAYADLKGWQEQVAKARGEMANGIAASQDNANLDALKQAGTEWKQFKDEVVAGTDEFTLANAKVKSEIQSLLDKGLPSDRILDSFVQVTAGVKDTGTAAAETAAKVQAELNKFFGPLDEVQRKVEAVNFSMLELRTSIKYAWEDNLPKLVKYRELLVAGKITQEEFNRALNAMGFTDSTNTPFDAMILKISELNRLVELGVLSAEKYQFLVQGMMAGASQFFQPATEMDALKQQTIDLEKEYKLQHDIAVSSKKFTQDQLLSMEKNYVQRMTTVSGQLREAQLNQTNAVLGLAATVSGQLEQLAGEGTAAAKAFFVAGRVIAIAQAIINTEVAATRALAEGGLFGGPVGAGIMRALGYASVGLIAAQTIASLDSGGQMPNSPRVGGVDGIGGRMIVAHPNEIIAHPEELNGGGGDLTVNVNNYTDAEVSVERSPDGKTIEIAVQRAQRAVADDIRKGGGPVSNALESTYRNRRHGN